MIAALIADRPPALRSRILNCLANADEDIVTLDDLRAYLDGEDPARRSWRLTGLGKKSFAILRELLE